MKTLLLAAAMLSRMMASQPAMGDKAQDFELQSLDGKMVRLSDETAKGPVVLIALRGFPGYQCPMCNRQVNEFIKSAPAFAEMGARVVMVYPGPPDSLNEHAREFTADKPMPANFTFLLDPDYKFTNLYGLRWNKVNETAYPSTFLIDKDGSMFFTKISDSHGGRSTPSEVLAILKAKLHGE